MQAVDLEHPACFGRRRRRRCEGQRRRCRRSPAIGRGLADLGSSDPRPALVFSCRAHKTYGEEVSDVEPIPETRYAHALDGAQVAYQVVGSNPILMLSFNALMSIDVMWEDPRFVRFLDRLSSFSRHVWFDPRGTGSSASSRGDEGGVIESATDDMVTVLDALGEERAIVLGLTPPPALLFAATYPARTAARVLLEPSARFRSDDGYTGLDSREVERMLAMLEREWGTGVFARLSGWGR
jgi:hypothetical protein